LIGSILEKSMTTISLRDIARHLAKSKNPGARGIAVDELLHLLRNGEINAGIHFPALSPVWVPIPSSHWLAVDASKLRSSLRTNDGPGAYKERISQFVEELSRAVIESSNTDALPAELKNALSKAGKKYDVAVLAPDWGAYLAKKGLPQTISGPNRGRPTGKGWRAICELVAAHYFRETDKQLTQESVAKSVFDEAKKLNIADLPAELSIRDVIANGYRLANRSTPNK
jgi:hypothetical protein